MNALLQEVQKTFPEATWSKTRGKVFLNGMAVASMVNGVPVSFTRRRYSNATFTWADAFIGGQWVSLGDPWQSINPPTKALAAAIAIRQTQTVYHWPWSGDQP